MALNLGTLVATLRLKADGFKGEAGDAVQATKQITDTLDDLAKQADKTAAAVVGAAAAAAEATATAAKGARDAKGRFLPKGGGAAGGVVKEAAQAIGSSGNFDEFANMLGDGLLDGVGRFHLGEKIAGAIGQGIKLKIAQGMNAWSGLVMGARQAVADIKAHFATLKESAGDFASVSAGALVAAAGLAALVKHSVDAAAAYQETTGKIKSVFGESNLAVEEWAKTTAHGMAMGQQEARKYASDLGAVIAPMVGSQKAAAGMSTRLTELGADLAAAFDSSNADAILAIRSAITGETEPMKRFGVVMNDANLAAYALSSGAKKLYKDMSLAEKSQLRYNFILSQTTLIQGTASQELSGFAAQMRLATGVAEDLAVKFGEPMRAALTPLLAAFNRFAETISNVSPGVAELVAKVVMFATAATGVVGVVTGIAAALGGLGIIMPTIIAGFATMFTTVLPIVVIIGVLIVVIGALYRAWKQSKDAIVSGAGELKNKVLGALSTLADGARNLFMAIVGIIVDAQTAPLKGIIKFLDVQLLMLQKVLQKMKGVAEAFGLSDMASSIGKALDGVSGARQGLAFDTQSIDDLGENIKKAFDPSEIWKNTIDFWGAGGAGREALSDAGDAVVDAMKNGVGGFVELLSDALGVDMNQKDKPKQQGVDQNLKPLDGKKPGSQGLFGLSDAVKAAKKTIFTSFGDAIREAVKDPETWKASSWEFAYGAADALKNLLPEAGEGLGGEISKSIKAALEEGAGNAFDFLQTKQGQGVAAAGGDALDSLLKGDFKIPDLGSIGSLIGDSIAPGLGGVVGDAVGGAVTKAMNAVVEKIGQLVGEIKDGFIEMATIVSDIIVSNLGDKAQGTISGFGQGAAFVAAAMSTAAALLTLIGVIGAVVAVLTPFALIAASAAATILLLFGWLLILIGAIIALNVIIVGVLLSPLIALAIVVGAVVAVFFAIVAVLTLAVGWFVALLQIGTMTKSFARFSLALEWGARSIIAATEPLFAALMPLAAIAIVMLETFAKLSGTFLSLLENMGFFQAFFAAVQTAGVMILQFALAAISGVEYMVKVFKNLAYTLGFDDIGDSLQKVDDAIDDWQSTLEDSIADLAGMTYESAMARAIEAARMEELAQAMDEATAGALNLPEAFKLNLARGRAITPGLGDADGPLLPADKRLVVNVWINGERADELRAEQERADRFDLLIDTGIAGLGKKPRRRWNSPGPKN